ncbi:hypothetical protein ACFLUD_03675 [Chloroflexota bacterium]
MFKQRNLFRLTVILAVVLALVVIAVFTPVVPWLKGALSPIVETPQPTITPVEPPSAPPAVVEPPPPVVEPPPPVESSEPENTIILSEEELQDIVDALTATANRSDTVNIEYVRVRLDQDKMLVSAEGEAMGRHVETKDMEVRFVGRTMFVSGNVSALGFTPTLIAEVEISSEEGKPSVDVKRFKLGGVLLLLKMMGVGLSADKISGLINDTIEASGLKLPFDVESIRIEDGKLIITHD